MKDDCDDMLQVRPVTPPLYENHNGDRYWGSLDETGSFPYNIIPHRENDKPAIIHANGRQEWYWHGQLHRDDGPAVIRENGRQEWRRNGLLHREGAPAVIYPTGGSEEWWVNGNCRRIVIFGSVDLWYDESGRLHRDDGPAAVQLGTQEWYRHGQWHREDGPAVIRFDGTQEWYFEGQRHREDGPAVIWPNGVQEYWIHDECTGTEYVAQIEFIMGNRV
jgi:hypothetical protein